MRATQFHSSRRRTLRWFLGACALAGWPRAGARAQPSGPRRLTIDLPQLAYDGIWNPREGAMEELAREVRLRSRVEPTTQTSVVRPLDAGLFDNPFLYIAAEAPLPTLTAAEIARLRRFMDLGGLLVVDDASAGVQPAVRTSAEALLRATAPAASLRPVTADHVLFRSFYLVDRPIGRADFGRELLGVHEAGRLKAIFVPGDLGGALCRDVRGGYRYPCNPGGPAQREEAIRLGVNIVLYATCTDYKSDRAHVEALAASRRRR